MTHIIKDTFLMNSIVCFHCLKLEDVKKNKKLIHFLVSNKEKTNKKTQDNGKVKVAINAAVYWLVDKRLVKINK